MLEVAAGMSLAAYYTSGGSVIASVFLAIILISLGIALYAVPSFVAWRRQVPNTGSVIVINVLFGWTLLGWGIALAMACRSLPKDAA